jgi:hypothetical protein
MVAGNAKFEISRLSVASELPTAISQLQSVDEKNLRLETPPLYKDRDEQVVSQPVLESAEPYYEPASNGGASRAEANEVNALPNQPVSLYDAAVPLQERSTASTAAKPMESAARHGWKKVKVEW